MISSNLVNNFGSKWYYDDKEDVKLCVKGFSSVLDGFFLGDKFINQFSFIKKWNNAHDDLQGILENTIKNLNGNFAVIFQGKDWLFASVDRVRSIPLFYGEKNNDFFLSDKASWIRKQIDGGAPCEILSDEFLLTGYVIGRDTLFSNIKQLQAGEYIWAKIEENKIKITTQRYYRFLHRDILEGSGEDFFPLYYKTLLNVFNRLIESTRGKTIVVPLSGGKDSRLIVTMLKILGKKGVICLSYGRPRNLDVRTSNKVAKILGYEWIFIPYSCKKIEQYFCSETRREYFDLAGNYSVIPHFGNWSAVGELKRQHLIPDNSVFVPGLGGDFLCGSHISNTLLVKKNAGKDDLIKDILGYDYYLWDWSKLHNLLSPKFYERILSAISGLQIDSLDDVANVFEFYQWQERQSKFVINSVRAYELFGYDWRIPFWDNEMMLFWERIPLESRLGGRLYSSYLFKRIFPRLKITFSAKTFGIVTKIKWKLLRKIQLKTNISFLVFECLHKYSRGLEIKFRKPSDFYAHVAALYLSDIINAEN